MSTQESHISPRRIFLMRRFRVNPVFKDGERIKLGAEAENMAAELNRTILQGVRFGLCFIPYIPGCEESVELLRPDAHTITIHNERFGFENRPVWAEIFSQSPQNARDFYQLSPHVLREQGDRFLDALLYYNQCVLDCDYLVVSESPLIEMAIALARGEAIREKSLQHGQVAVATFPSPSSVEFEILDPIRISVPA